MRGPSANHTVTGRDGTTIVAVSGDIDLLVAPDLHEWICAAAKDNPSQPLQVDLSEVTFLDSTGIRALVQARQDTAETGVQMTITNARGLIAEVLAITGVYEFLTGEV